MARAGVASVVEGVEGVEGVEVGQRRLPALAALGVRLLPPRRPPLTEPDLGEPGAVARGLELGVVTGGAHTRASPPEVGLQARQLVGRDRRVRTTPASAVDHEPPLVLVVLVVLVVRCHAPSVARPTVTRGRAPAWGAQRR